MANPFDVQVASPASSLQLLLQGYEGAHKQGLEQQKRSALQQLMNGGGASDPNAVANTLLSSGDTSGAATYANLAQTIEQRKAQAERDARDFKFRQDEAQRTQGNADRSYGQQAQQNAFQRAQANKPSIQRVKDADGNETLLLVNPDGTSRPITPAEASAAGSVSPPVSGNPFGPGKFNEGEGKAAGFADRMLQSEAVLRSTNGKPDSTAWIHDQGADFNQTQLSAARSAPFGIGRIANYGISEDRQKYNQAQEDFIIAQLRRESGAAISPDEFTKAQRQYFPAPGDTQEIINQKAATRRAAVEAMGREGGRSYRPKLIYTADGRVVPLPKVGEVKDGYRFKGGDPSNQNSWVKAQ